MTSSNEAACCTFHYVFSVSIAVDLVMQDGGLGGKGPAPDIKGSFCGCEKKNSTIRWLFTHKNNNVTI